MAMDKALSDSIYSDDTDDTDDLATGFAVLTAAVATAYAAVRAIDNGDDADAAARECKDALVSAFTDLGLLPKISNDDYGCDDCDCGCDDDDPWDDEAFYDNGNNDDDDDDDGHKTDGRKTVTVKQLRDNLGRGIGVSLTIPTGCTDADIRDALYAVVERYED